MLIILVCVVQIIKIAILCCSNYQKVCVVQIILVCVVQIILVLFKLSKLRFDNLKTTQQIEHKLPNRTQIQDSPIISS